MVSPILLDGVGLDLLELGLMILPRRHAKFNGA